MLEDLDKLALASIFTFLFIVLSFSSIIYAAGYYHGKINTNQYWKNLPVEHQTFLERLEREVNE